MGAVRLHAAEWASYGMTVNAVAAGPVDTPLRHTMQAEPTESFSRMLGGVAIEELIPPAHVAAAVRYFLYDAARLVTGVVCPSTAATSPDDVVRVRMSAPPPFVPPGRRGTTRLQARSPVAPTRR